ncbi:RING-H2 zinc finger protein RHA1a [Madurella fahalii]|uniref:RING-H2 zinc finger protein RHA1a n=1 Tax=Madurella fahalii TaxID=1157608 RepID=A0ABQ0FXH5_9PEZI
MSDNVNVLDALDEIRNVILLFSNPSWTGVGTISSTVIRNITASSSAMTYSVRFTGNTTVLSTRYSGTADGVIQGLLYVPDLPWLDPCVDETAPYVPFTAARRRNLPPTNFHLIALAPWVNARCSEAYLASARSAPVRAMLFYTPGNSSDAPPAADSPTWHIHGNADWMSQSNWPIFAVPGLVGQIMMQQSSLYSGNLTEAPFGPSIANRFRSDPEDYLRVWSELVVSTPPVAIGTWVYFLIVVGVLLGVVTTASFLMHFVQARRRAQLRRRVCSGEVNLEAMGIKKLTVPIGHIQKFPLFTYHYEPDISSSPLSPRSAKPTRSGDRRHGRDQAASVAASRLSRPGTFPEHGGRGSVAPSTITVATEYQPACEICLQPYENRSTIIRELPCGHIFHPECIDEFLSEVSSLCPLCKASMLPRGYCPRVTNTMVRRERAVRRLRGRIVVQDFASQDEPKPGWLRGIKDRIFSADSNRKAPSSTSTELRSMEPRPTKSERQQIQPQLPPNIQAPDATAGAAPTALARERMRELAGPSLDDGEEGLPLWKRMRNRVFPGL